MFFQLGTESSQESTECLVGLGSNVGDCESILQNAVDGLRSFVDVTAVTGWYCYPAVGGPSGQRDYLNGVVRGETSVPPDDLIQFLLGLEAAAGRRRGQRWSSRTLDCDLLLYGSLEFHRDTLQIPHPRMVTRRFVLEPACDIAGEMIHPTTGWTLSRLLSHLESARCRFCVIGSRWTVVRHIARSLADELDCQLNETVRPLSSSDAEGLLEWTGAAQAVLPTRDSKSVSTFWVGEPYLFGLQPSSDWVSEPIPKLVIVAEPQNTEYGRRFALVAPECRVPTLFLSADLEHATQDAVGSVLAMK